jgi:tryptophanyl-tRNA synthetase
MTKYISGIRPSGKLHLGNYIGSILPAIKYNADVLIASYHSPEGDTQTLYDELLNYFPPDKIKLHKDIFNPGLFFKLLAVTPSGLLNHMPQYKEKEKTALMFTYPVLMAHDLVGYDFVIVGDDQRPHIEFANDILYRVGEKCPQPIYEGGRIMDLRNPEEKMSKSRPTSCLFMSDDKETIEKKIRRAVTNEAGRKNLENIYQALHIDGSIPPRLNIDLKKEIIRVLTYRAERATMEAV